MKKIKLNKLKLGLLTLGIIGAIAITTPILVSCGGGNSASEHKEVLTKEITKNNFAVGGIWEGKTEFVKSDFDKYGAIGNGAFQNWLLISIEIGDSIKSIGASAFDSNKLTSVKIGDSVTTIGDNAFSFNKLTSITIPDAVKSIGNSAFMQNTLTSVHIGNSVKFIGTDAFSYNELTSVTIPDSVTSIGRQSFFENKFTSSTDIKMSEKLLNSVCDWKDENGGVIAGNGITVKDNFELIFGI